MFQSVETQMGFGVKLDSGAIVSDTKLIIVVFIEIKRVEEFNFIGVVEGLNDDAGAWVWACCYSAMIDLRETWI